MANPTDFDLFKGFSLANLSPDQQMAYFQADAELQKKLMAGNIEARALFETATANYTEWQRQEKAAELEAAKESWKEPPVSNLDDPEFGKRFFQGDVAAIAEFDALTRQGN